MACVEIQEFLKIIFKYEMSSFYGIKYYKVYICILKNIWKY